MKSRWDTAANVVIVVSGVLLCLVLVTRFRESATTGPPFVGRLVQLPPELGATGSDKTLLLYVDADCGYCTRSMPFYQRLTRLAVDPKHPFRVIVVTDDTINRVRSYLASHSVGPFDTALISNTDLRLPGTPSLLVLGSGRRVLGAWFGLLGPDEESQVIAVLVSA